MLASGPLLIDRSNDMAAAAPTDYDINGKTYTFVGATAAAEFFDLCGMNPLALQASKKVDISETQFGTFAGYTNDTSAKYNNVNAGAEIIRVPAPVSVGGGTAAEAVAIGALGAAADAAGNPTNFVVIQ